MVGHESVDPKPQAKADLVTGVIFVYFLTRGVVTLNRCLFYERHR